MNINERIELLINELGFNKNSFSKEIGLSSNTVLQNILGGRKNKPSYDVLSKILLTFDSIDANWLITGNGNMYKPSYKSTVNFENANINTSVGQMNGGRVKGGNVYAAEPATDYNNIVKQLKQELSEKDKELSKAKDKIIELQEKLINNL